MRSLVASQAAQTSPQSGGLIEALADPIDRTQSTERLVWTVPVVMVNPLGKLITGLRCPGIHCRPELLEHGPLHALDLAVQVR